jgi:hypothetical protein
LPFKKVLKNFWIEWKKAKHLSVHFWLGRWMMLCHTGMALWGMPITYHFPIIQKDDFFPLFHEVMILDGHWNYQKKSSAMSCKLFVLLDFQSIISFAQFRKVT